MKASLILALLPALALATPVELEARDNWHVLKLGKPCKEPSSFTSAVSTRAVNTTIINNDGQSVPGQAGARGHFGFKLNSKENKICWDITTVGVTGDYQSPAKTATHIHQADVGRAGPPRLAFPNPEFKYKDVEGKEVRVSKGCAQGPFRTGIDVAGQPGTDTGSASGFTIAQLENNPAGFFADTHTAAFAAGAIRGQLQKSEVPVKRPKRFTHSLKGVATDGNVITPAPAQQPVAGEKGAKAWFNLDLDVDNEILCYHIKTKGVTGKYFSQAKTSTHVHRSPAGTSGPPVISFKNPQKVWWGWKTRKSEACVKGPFTTGLLNAQGRDTGNGFKLADLVANPENWAIDTHTEKFIPGAVRGQLARK